MAVKRVARVILISVAYVLLGVSSLFVVIYRMIVSECFGSPAASLTNVLVCPLAQIDIGNSVIALASSILCFYIAFHLRDDDAARKG
jgi:hypothetical protein